MCRSLVVLAMTLAAVLGLAPPSSASEPIITRSGPFEVMIPFPEICAFPLTATVSGNTHSLTFVDAAGNPKRGFAAGQLFVTWARDDTGASRTFAIAGPSFFDAAGSVIRGTGRWVTLLEGTGLVLASGNLTLNELQAITAMNGHASSICDLMS